MTFHCKSLKEIYTQELIFLLIKYFLERYLSSPDPRDQTILLRS